MALALVALAIGSVVAGYIGFPHALGGSNRLEAYLEPSFTVSAGREASGETGAENEGPASEGSEQGTEQMLMLLSSAIAVGGIGLAWYFFRVNPSAAEAVAERAGGIRTLLLNKYYVDEVYDAAIVQPIKLLSTGGLWGGVDAGLIDGAVNGVGQMVRGASGGLRRLQTGSVRTYAASLFLGVVLILGWYLLTT